MGLKKSATVKIFFFLFSFQLSAHPQWGRHIYHGNALLNSLCGFSFSSASLTTTMEATAHWDHYEYPPYSLKKEATDLLHDINLYETTGRVSEVLNCYFENTKDTEPDAAIKELKPLLLDFIGECE